MGEREEGLREDQEHWLTHPFASTFDLILSEYAGYTDQSLLQVTLTRLRQMREIIFRRRREELHRELEIRENELRTICQFIAAAQGQKKLAKQAAGLKLYRRPRAMPSTERVERMFGALEFDDEEVSGDD